MERIHVYARIRPKFDKFGKPIVGCKKLDFLKIVEDKRIELLYNEKQFASAVDNRPEILAFDFTHVFNMDCNQKTIYKACSERLVRGALDGFNGTLVKIVEMSK